jgi:hypothetical protein
MEEELTQFPEIESFLQKNPCINSANCELTEVTSGQATLKKEQILVLESISLPRSSFTRYRNRFSGFYLQNKDGSYRRLKPVAQVSKPFLEIMDRLNENTNYTSKKTPNLGWFLAQHSQLKIQSDDFFVTTHSDRVVEFAIDRNPDANFVLADNPLITDNMICKALTKESDDLRDFKVKLSNALFDLNEIIRNNKIQYVNMSFLSTPESLSQYMRGACNSSDSNIAKKIVHIYNLFYLKLLEQNPNLVLVQSVSNDDHQSYECPFHRRWIRVGYTNRVNSAIPHTGEDLTPEGLAPNLTPVLSCITTAINSGIEDAESYENRLPRNFSASSLFYNYSGLYGYPINVMSTSWATPIVLSFLRAQNVGIKADLIYTSVINRIFDPLIHKQFISLESE